MPPSPHTHTDLSFPLCCATCPHYCPPLPYCSVMCKQRERRQYTWVCTLHAPMTLMSPATSAITAAPPPSPAQHPNSHGGLTGKESPPSGPAVQQSPALQPHRRHRHSGPTNVTITQAQGCHSIIDKASHRHHQRCCSCSPTAISGTAAPPHYIPGSPFPLLVCLRPPGVPIPPLGMPYRQ